MISPVAHHSSLQQNGVNALMYEYLRAVKISFYTFIGLLYCFTPFDLEFP